MTKRTLAALCALLVAASTLAVVAASPASAHTKTVRRCAYDPFAGNQCWNENVAHTHTPPPTCGEGMLGTYPNCYPAPSTNENRDPNADKDDGDGSDGGGSDDGDGSDEGGGSEEEGGSDGGEGSDDVCPDGQTGTPPNCTEPNKNGKGGGGTDDVCPDGQTGTPPNCTEPNKNGKGGGSGGGSDDGTITPSTMAITSTQRAVGDALATGWSWLSGAVKWVFDNNAKVSEAEANAWEAQSEATRQAVATAANQVVDGLEAFARSLGESERQRINANTMQVRSVLQGWQKLNPYARAAIGGTVCGALSAPVVVGSGGAAVAGGAVFGGACATAAFATESIPLPQLIPADWTPPGDSDTDPSDTGPSDRKYINRSNGGGSNGGGSDRDDGSGGGSNGSDPDDLDGDGDFDNDDVNEARRKMARGELDPNEYIRLHRRNECSKPGHCQ